MALFVLLFLVVDNKESCAARYLAPGTMVAVVTYPGEK